jgi:cephalosporin hydroxylase
LPFYSGKNFHFGKLHDLQLLFFFTISQVIHNAVAAIDRAIKTHIHVFFLRAPSTPPAVAEPAASAGKNKQGIHAIL